MPKQTKTKLTRQTEAKLSKAKKKAAAPPATEADTQRRIHELEVHQIELEMQNEELTQLRTKEEIDRVLLMLDMAPNSITVHDFKGRFLYANQVTFELHGFTRNEFMAFTLHQLDVPDSSNLIEQRMQELLNCGKAIFEVAHYRKDGSILPMEVNAKVTTWGNDKVILSVATDITERKQKEETLIKSKTMLTKAQKLGHMGNWGWDIATNETTWSEEIYMFYGLDPEKDRLDFDMLINSLTPECKEDFLKTIADTLKHQKPFDGEYSILRQDGTLRHIHVKGEVLRDKEGNPIQSYVGMVQDITERKQAEKALRESEIKLRTIFENSVDAIGVSKNGIQLMMNQAYISLFGYSSANELINQPVLNLIAPSEHEMILERIRSHAKGEVPLPQYETRGRRKDGTEFDMDIHVSAYELEDEIYSLVILRDITERKQTDKTLRLRESYLTAILENQPGLVWLKDIDGHFLAVNQAFADSCGKASPVELVGKTDLEIWPKELAEKYRADDFRIIKDKTSIVVEEPIFDHEKITWFETFKTPVFDDKRNMIGTTGYSRDISERKQAEKQLKDTLESLRKSVDTTIQVMASAVERRDPYTSGHQIRSTTLALAIATEMGLPQEKIDAIQMASSIHDIGKLSIPAEILSKPTKLSEIEFSLIKQHSYQGYDILKNVESPWPLAEIVCQHHERMDGSGYPKNLKGDEIMIEARIIGVADVVESMASHRPYRPALGIDAALTEIEKNKGIIYDERVVDACLRLFREKGFSLK